MIWKGSMPWKGMLFTFIQFQALKIAIRAIQNYGRVLTDNLDRSKCINSSYLFEWFYFEINWNNYNLIDWQFNIAIIGNIQFQNNFY